jgi:Tropinone reductase 1
VPLQVFLCSRSQSDVDACLQQLTAKGYQVSGAAVDVADLAQRQQLVQQVSAAFDGKLNILGGAPCGTGMPWAVAAVCG